MPKRKVNNLTNLVLKEISLVDDPANPHATVDIVKVRSDDDFDSADKSRPGGVPESSDEALARAQNEEAIMKTIEEVTAALEASESRMAEITKAISDQGIVIADITKERDELKAALVVAKSGKAPAEEDITKGMSPVQKAAWDKMISDNAANAEAIQKMQDKAADDEAIAKAKVLNVGDPALLGPALRRVKIGKSTEADALLIEQVLKAAGERDKSSPLFQVVGSSVSADGTDPEAALKAKATEIQKSAGGTLTFAAAYEKAMNDNPGLYADYINKSRRA
jgi:hypothetical protein